MRSVDLQNRFGYVLRISVAHASGHGYILRNAEGDEALVHARAGTAPVPRDANSLPADAVDHWYVFSPTNTYGPDPAPNVREIDAEDVIDFIRGEPWSLPLRVSDCLEQALDDELVSAE